jgi:hypothetical protein
MFATTLTLAAGLDVQITNANFFEVGVGLMVAGVLQVIGVIVVIAALFNSGKLIITGDIWKATRTVFGAALFATLMFQPQLFSTLISNLSGLSQSFIESIGNLLSAP